TNGRTTRLPGRTGLGPDRDRLTCAVEGDDLRTPWGDQPAADLDRAVTPVLNDVQPLDGPGGAEPAGVAAPLHDQAGEDHRAEPLSTRVEERRGTTAAPALFENEHACVQSQCGTVVALQGVAVPVAATRGRGDVGVGVG